MILLNKKLIKDMKKFQKISIKETIRKNINKLYENKQQTKLSNNKA